LEDHSDIFVEDETLNADMYYMATHASAITTYQAESLQNSKDKVRSLTTDEFLIEAYNSATQLRNTLGDADALVYELTESIRMNILVVAISCRKNPADMILSSARALPAEEQNEFLSNAIALLSSYKRSIESETLSAY
jgi:hypothetical protein